MAAAAARRCAMRLGDADAHSWEELGDIYEEQGRLAEAIEAYQQAIRAIGEAQANDDAPISDLGEAWMKLGNAHEAHGQRTEAVAAYDQAIAPLVAVMVEGEALQRDEWASLGRMYDRQGKHQEAAKAFEKAVAQYREALRLRPGDPFAHKNLGNVFARQGRFDEAALHYREALRSWPDDPQARYNLGIVPEAMGQTEEAGRHLMEANRLRMLRREGDNRSR